MNLKSFFKRQILVARVYGIPVRIDYRWFVVFALSVVLIASNVSKYPMQIVTVRLPAFGDLPGLWLGLATTLALFLSVFGHELSHALVGRAEGIEIEEIVLHPFGGLARLRTQPQSPRAEFRIAVAGPAASRTFRPSGVRHPSRSRPAPGCIAWCGCPSRQRLTPPVVADAGIRPRRSRVRSRRA